MAEEILNLVLDTLVKSRKLQRRLFSQDSCIAATRIAIRTAAYYGIVFRPVHVSCAIFNPWVTKQIERHGSWPHVDQLTAWTTSERGYGLGLGFPSPEQPFPGLGHVIAVGSGLVVDLSLDQAARPQKRINLDAFWLPVENEQLDRFLAGDSTLVLKIEGCFVVYDHRPSDVFLQSGDWTIPERTDPVVEWIIKNVDRKRPK